MAKKGVFDQDFNEIVEFDDSLDVNAILENPDNDTLEDEDEDKDKKSDTEDVSDINKVFETQAADDTEDVDKDASEDEDDETQKTDDDSPAFDKTKKSSSDAPFTVIFARDMIKQGLLSSFDEEEFIKDIDENGEANALRGLIRREVELNIETAKGDLEEGYKQYLSLVGKGVDPEAALNLTAVQERLAGIKETELDDENNQDLRKEIIRSYFHLTTQFSEDKINKAIQRSIDLGDDVEESKEYLKEMGTIIKDQISTQEQEAEQQTQLREQEKKRQLDTLKDTINSMSEIIPGQKINKQTKDKLYNMITKPIEDKNGRVTSAIWAKRAEDPLLFDTKVAYLVETGFFEKDKPWDKIKTVKTTKEASELEDRLSSLKNTDSTKGIPPSLGSVGSQELSEIMKSTASILK